MLFQPRFSVQSPFPVLVLIVATFFCSCKPVEPVEIIEPADSSAYISTVFEYVYAPGQHAKLAKLTDVSNFVGVPAADRWLYLGGFGGYVIAGFNHNVVNASGPDIEVFALKGSSPEPAVVYVMSDTNGDGKPNETWYELKGNQFENSMRNYWVRYYKAANDSSNIKWKDSNGQGAELKCGFGSKYSAGWWWPVTPNDSVTFYGTRLPDAYVNNSSTETEYWVVPTNRFTTGYAENMYGVDYELFGGGNLLDISNAVDASGNAVMLANVRFIKVQTAVFQQAGWTNEVSSEVRGAKDLNW